MKGNSIFRRIPRKLRRIRRGEVLSKILFLFLGALVLRLFFSLLGQSSSIWQRIDADLFESVLSLELGNSERLNVLNPGAIISGQSAVLVSLPAFDFHMAADDEFSGDFSFFGTEAWSKINEKDTEDKSDHDVDSRSEPLDAEGSVGTDEDDAENTSSDSSVNNGPDVNDDPDVRTVTIVPISPTGYDHADGVFIKNETDYSIDVASYLNKAPEVDLTGDGPVILVVHTHASEAYYPDGEDIYVPTDTERTDDKNYNVVRVGDELVSAVEERGYSVAHIRDIFDYPSYSGSYTRTLKSINAVLKENPSIQIIIDIHRDAMISASGSTYRTITEINGENAAQILLVVGTNEGGLKHPNWRENLTLAVHLQKHICDDYPLLARPINLRSERFNQHATKGSLILEVGTSSNTLKEALYSARLFAGSLCDLLDAFASQQ